MLNASESHAGSVEERPVSAVAAALLRNGREFLSFLERRVGSRPEAEDILQDAFARGLHDRRVRDDALVVAWFYRVLRKAVADRARRHAAKARVLEKFATELEEAPSNQSELHAKVCRCVAKLTQTLKPEYRDALRGIEVVAKAVKDYAAEAGISAGTAAIRVFRARQALREQVARACGACSADGVRTASASRRTVVGGGRPLARSRGTSRPQPSRKVHPNAWRWFGSRNVKRRSIPACEAAVPGPLQLS